MDTTLVGCAEKLIRADDHAVVLQREMARHPKTVGLRIHHEPDPSTAPEIGWTYFQVVDLPHLPARWGAIIGDIAHNLRSVLDHLTWQLGRFNLGRDPHKWRAFPIADTPEWFAGERAQQRISDLRPEHRAMIERCQPYQRSGWQEPFRPLAWLRELSNTDKDKIVAPTLIAPENPKHARLLSVRGCDSVTPYYWVGPPLAPGIDLIKLKVKRPRPDFEVRMNYDFTPVITFWGGQPVEKTLEAMRSVVIGVLQPSTRSWRLHLSGWLESTDPLGTLRAARPSSRPQEHSGDLPATPRDRYQFSNGSRAPFDGAHLHRVRVEPRRASD